MNLEFLSEAREEFLGSSLYYEAKEPGLGVRFRDEVAHVLGRIVSDPYLWRERPGAYRRVNCPVFPYYIAYFIRKHSILVAAIAHGQSKPDYWRSRCPSKLQ